MLQSEMDVVGVHLLYLSSSLSISFIITESIRYLSSLREDSPGRDRCCRSSSSLSPPSISFVRRESICYLYSPREDAAERDGCCRSSSTLSVLSLYPLHEKRIYPLSIFTELDNDGCCRSPLSIFILRREMDVVEVHFLSLSSRFISFMRENLSVVNLH